MKLLIILTIVLLLIGIPVLAQNVTLMQAGLLPDNPFHPFQDFFEQLQLFFAFSPKAKANTHLQLTEKRLAELNLVIEQNKTDLIPILSDKFEKELNDTENEINFAKALGQNVTELAQHVAGETFKHQLVLQNLLDKVPEQARPSIANAINKSQEGHIAAVESILESGNATGNINMTFVVRGQTFTQTFVVSREHGKPKILRGGIGGGENENISEIIITTITTTATCPSELVNITCPSTTTTTSTTTTSPPINPLQILSVQPIPANPKIGDTLNFNVTVKNVGNVPIYYSVGSGGNALIVSYSPSGFFGPSSSACSPLLRALTIQSNEIANVGLVCPEIYSPLIKSGILTANLSFRWGYVASIVSIFSNSISTLYAIDVSPANTTTSTTTTTSPPTYPVQILSVQTIPANPKVGDTLNFNVTVRNDGNVPIYYGGGAASTLSATYSNTSIFEDAVGSCSNSGFLPTLTSTQSASVYLACSNRQLNSTGVTVANLTFAWGYDTSHFNNSISFLQTVNIS